jgi:putative hemolysin
MEAAIIITCLLLSAFFSGMEIAYLSANKVYLGVEAKQHTLLSKILTRLTQNPAQFIASMLVGNSIVLVVYGYYMGIVALRWFMPDVSHIHSAWQLLLQACVSTFIILLTAEFLPKVFFQVYANLLIRALAIPAFAFYSVFFYISKAVIAVSDFILVKIFKTKGDKQKAFFTRGELGTYITEQITAAGTEQEVDSEIQMFKNALEFSGLTARDIMTQRTEIAAVEMHDPVTELRELFVNTGYSKIVVYRGSIDTIIGYIHSFELFKKPQAVTDFMIAMEQVPETIFIRDLLNLLTVKRKSMAVVVDANGATAGIITVEDIIEELFGDIEDEHDDTGTIVAQAQPDGSWLFSARLEVAYVNQTYGLSLPESEFYSSLGGLVVHCAGGVPEPEKPLSAGGYMAVVVQASGKMVEVVKIIPQTIK